MLPLMASKVRLYVEHPLGEGQSVVLTQPQAHYLTGVMRLGVGAVISVLNGVDGEWDAELVEAGKRKGVLLCHAQTKPLQVPPDLWLLFAPIKKARTDFIVEKAAEMGAKRIVPIQTAYTNADRIRVEKLQAHVIEAVEQCGGTYVPQVTPLQKLGAVLDGWSPERRLMFCDETMLDQPSAMSGSAGPWAIIIGPEGGFSDPERTRLRAMPAATPVSLGPRILRADTAAVAAMTLWQSRFGDWQ